MPYPVEKLPYGLRRRLRELATPGEAYAFQIAAPNYYGLQPIQKMRKVDYVNITMDEEKNLKRTFEDRNSTLTDDDETLLNIASNIVIFNSFTPNDNLNVIFKTLRFSPKEIEFDNCLLDTAFVKNFLKSLKAPIEFFSLSNSSFTSEDAVKMICNAPAVKTLRIINIIEPRFPSVSSWIESFVQAECTSLEELFVNEALPSIFEINKTLFLKFFKAQNDRFVISFNMSAETEPDSILDLLKNLFDEHFEYTKIDDSIEKKCVNIRFNNELFWRSYTLRDN